MFSYFLSHFSIVTIPLDMFCINISFVLLLHKFVVSAIGVLKGENVDVLSISESWASLFFCVRDYSKRDNEKCERQQRGEERKKKAK